jgi:hypothetical protein
MYGQLALSKDCCGEEASQSGIDHANPRRIIRCREQAYDAP